MDDKGNNVINNYKGVMLCSRPNENNAGPIEKPFCGRVYNHDQIGLVPPKQERRQGESPKKAVPAILSRHKKWLEEFKEKQHKAKEQMEQRSKQEEERFKKIKQLAENDRERAKKMKEEYNQTATQVISILDESQNSKPSRPGELNLQNLRKLDQANEQKQSAEVEQDPTRELLKKMPKKKPMWAVSKEEREQKEEEEVDDLLDFFDNTDVEKFSEDEQVKSILINLKDKINQIKATQDWKQKEARKLQEQREERRRRRAEDNEDITSRASGVSGNSEARSIASEKTQQKLEQLRKKKESQEWDKYTASNKQSFANIEDRIAKNLADEVLRNYPNLKGVHSNNSIRKLIEAEATKAMYEPIPRPIITTVVKDPKPLDASNLPYLHRNPAI